MSIPGLDRLGLGPLISEHGRTLYWVDDQGRRHVRSADWIVLVATPLLVAVLASSQGVRLHNVTAMLTGTAILTGGLFTLLVTMLGVQLLGTGVGGSDRVARLLKEARANVAYAAVVAVTLVFLLMITDGLAPPPPPGESAPGLGAVSTALLLAAFGHLFLVLLLVINRVRLAFSKNGFP